MEVGLLRFFNQGFLLLVNAVLLVGSLRTDKARLLIQRQLGVNHVHLLSLDKSGFALDFPGELHY